MALEITRRADGGITLCTNVCTALTPADVAMLDKQARAYHGRLHAGTTSGSALGPDIIGDDDVGGAWPKKTFYVWADKQVYLAGRNKPFIYKGRGGKGGGRRWLSKWEWQTAVSKGKRSAIHGDDFGDVGDDDDSIVVKAVKLPFTGLKYAGKGAWWVTKESGKGVGKGFASLFSGDDDVGLPLQRRGGHMEIMGPASNREFLRERRYMGGYYEEVGERFPADGVGKGDDFSVSKGSRRKAAEPYRRAYLEEADVIKALGQSGRPINGGTLARYVRLKSRYLSIKQQRPLSPEWRERRNQALRARFAALGWEVVGTSNVTQSWSGPAPAKGAAWEYANANQAK